MASASNSISTTNNYGGKFTLTASFNETATSTSNNNSTVSISATFQNNSTAAFSGQANPYLRVYWYDNNSYSSGTLIAQKQVSSMSSKGSTSVSGSITVGHKSDGTLNGYAKAVWTKGSGSNSYVPASTEVSTANTALTTIPRKTSITSFGVTRRDETSFSFSWEAKDTVDYLWYTLNNGSTWIGYDTADGTSGSFIVNGLSPNTTYNCNIKVRRKDSQLTTDPFVNIPATTYSIPTQSLKSKTETSITMNWKLDGNANYLWYSLNNGSTWTGYGNVSGSSGTYTISGLNANQTYNIKTKLRRQSTNTTYENGSVNLSVTTHPYPSIVENGVSKTDLKIGQSQTVTLNNPLSRNVTVYMKQNNTSGTTLYSGTTTGTSLTFTPNANTLYNSIPNSKEGNAVYYVVYSNQTSATRSGKYSIDNSQGQQNPTFSVTNWSYTANLTSLTNNDQTVINNQSTVTFSIDTPATSKNGASIAKYLLEWGTVNKETSTTEDTVVKGNGNLLKVTAIDSRGYQTLTSLDLGTNFINYINIQSTSSATEREDGVNANTTLNLRGTMFYDKFGSEGVQNQFTVAKYYVSTDNVNWSAGYNINLSNFTYQNNQYELRDYQIHANGSSGGFTIGTRYYIKVALTDKVSNTTITNILVTDGKLAVDTYQDNNGEYHRGINGLADSNYALKVHGNTKTNDIDAANENLSGNLKFTGGTGSVLPSHFYRNLHDTNGNVYDHYYKGTPTTNTIANLRVWDKTNNTFKVLRFGGDGVMQWNGNTFNAAAYRGVKTLSSKGHSGWGTNNNYVPDIAFITYWNGAYNSSNNSNLTYAHQGTIQCKPTSLYDNSSGTTGTVSLSQNISNFSYIEIYYRDNLSRQCGISKLVVGRGELITLGGIEGNNGVYIRAKIYKVSGTSITKVAASYFAYSGAIGYEQSGDYIYIHRVLGWK